MQFIEQIVSQELAPGDAITTELAAQLHDIAVQAAEAAREQNVTGAPLPSEIPEAPGLDYTDADTGEQCDYQYRGFVKVYTGDRYEYLAVTINATSLLDPDELHKRAAVAAQEVETVHFRTDAVKQALARGEEYSFRAYSITRNCR